MNKNIKLHISFLNVSGERFAILSKNKEIIEKTASDKVACFNSASQFFGLQNKINQYNSELTIGERKDKHIHEKLNELFSHNEVILIKNMANSYDVRTYLEIVANKYEGSEDWIKYLNENRLGDIWVNGNLSLNVKYNYEEYSKDFGSRKKEEINQFHLNEYDKIWDFEEIYKGKENFVSGEHYRYWYSTTSKFFSLAM